MARSPKVLQRLIDELAALTPEERVKVVVEVQRRKELKLLPRGFRPPRLGAGGKWVGGSLRCEALYRNDDSRTSESELE